MTKMSTLFIFDRETGEPLFGLEERPVPQSDVPGEATWPTQPFPLNPPPLSRTTFDPAKDFYTLTPEHAAYCRDLWDTHKMYTKGIFTPPGSRRHDGDVSEHARRRQLERPVVRPAARPRVHQHHEPRPGRAHGAPHRRRGPAPRPTSAPRRGTGPIGRFWNLDTRVPCSAPPFGELVAVNVNTASRRVARAARRVRRSESARIRRHRHAEHRRHDRDRRRCDLRRRHHRPAVPGVRRRDRASSSGKRRSRRALTPRR